MAYRDLREFIAALETKGELKRVRDEVDPVLEITEIADRSVKNGGPALLFENPKGSNVPVLINTMASMERMQLALEVDSLETVAGRISEYLQMKTPQGLVGKLKMLPKLAELGSFFPKDVSSGPCQEVVKKDDFSLYDYPVLTCWPQDGGPFITLPLVFSRNPESPASATAACTACRSTTSAPPACTGRPTSRAPSTTAACSPRASRRAWRSPSPSAPTPPPCSRPSCPCRPTSTR